MKTQVDIKLLNGSKQEVTYETVETVGMPLADGTGEQVFTAGEPLDNIPIALDFTNGDQQVEAPEGYVVRSAVIAKPEGVEKVIAKGVTAAGIVGEYVTPGTTKEIEPDFSSKTVETDILPLTTYNDFAFNSVFGKYMVTVSALYMLNVDETYIVEWDGETYECVGQDTSSVFGNGVAAIGNLTEIGLAGNSEPFVIITNPEHVNDVPSPSNAQYCALTDTEAGGSHTVRIYQSKETGDMVVTPSEEDERWNEVLVKKPETLIPENIATGVEIAGVVGAFEPPELCLFTMSKNATAGRTYSGAATGSYTATASISIPLASEIKAVCAAGNSFSQMNSSYLQYPVMYALAPVTNYTETVGSSTRTISWSKSITFSSSSYYGRAAVVMMVIFVVPGVTLRPIEGGLIFHCDATVTDIPQSQGYFPAVTEITEADLQESAITSISYAFYACSSLKKVILPDTLRTIGRQCFYNCRKLSEIAIPDGVTSISDYAFQYCVALSEIVIPSGVTNIGSSAFTGCSGLSQVTISAGVKTIGSQAFFGCTSLKQITIPNTVTSIAGSVFYGCTALEMVDCSSCTSVPALTGTNAFYNCPSTLQIKVPAALYDEWIAATNWSTYADKIVAV